MKRFIKVAMTFLLSATMIIGSTSMTSLAAEKSTTYVAIGDSITAQKPGYVDIVSDSINSGDTLNLAVDGTTSAEWVNKVKNNTSVRNSVKKADVITLTLGSNDIFFSIQEIVSKKLGCQNHYDAVFKKIDSLTREYANAKGFNKIYQTIRMGSLIIDINNTLRNSKTIDNNANKYYNNMKAIVNEIKTLNPDVKIYVGNMYNPLTSNESLNIMGWTVVDCREVAELWEKSFNSKLNSVGQITVIDLHNVLNSSHVIGNFDMHPNSNGQRVIADAFTKKMK